MTVARIVLACTLVVLGIVSSSCGGGGGGVGSTPPSSSSSEVTISISPTTVNVETGANAQFSAIVSRGTVTWTSTCGVISSEGLYKAPAQSGSCTVTATSTADSAKSASGTVRVVTPLPGASLTSADEANLSERQECAAGFSWLSYYPSFYEDPHMGAVGKALVLTKDGGAVAGVDSTPSEGRDVFAALVFYTADGSERAVLAEDEPSSISDMFVDPITKNIFVTGYYGTSDDSSGHAAMILSATSEGRVIQKSKLRLLGNRTEGVAVSVRDDRIYLVVRSDHRQCGLANGACSNDWLVITDMKGTPLTQFSVGNTNEFMVGDGTAATDMLVMNDSIWVVGDTMNRLGAITGSYRQRFSHDGRILSSDLERSRYRSKVVQERDEVGRFGLLSGSTVQDDHADWKSMLVEKRNSRGRLLGSSLYSASESNGATGDYELGDLAPNPTGGGATAVGTLSRTQDAGRRIAEGVIVSWKGDGQLFWLKRFDNMPSGMSISSVNGILYDADGRVTLVGAGSDGRLCGSQLCPLAVIGKSCRAAPAW